MPPIKYPGRPFENWDKIIEDDLANKSDNGYSLIGSVGADDRVLLIYQKTE